MLEPQSVVDRFCRAFGRPERLVLARAPGRVNLIGEHTDYNEGFVLPMAIEREVLIVGRAVDGDCASVLSTDFKRLAHFRLDDIRKQDEPAWLNYPLGVTALLKEAGLSVPAFEAVIAGDLPIGSGLSSSAALGVALVGFLLELAGRKMEPVEMARLARRAENEFVGVQCGIMDPLVSVMGRNDHALLIDCRDLAHRHIRTFGADCEFVLADTAVKHELAASQYHQRQDECRQAVAALAGRSPSVKALRDATLDDVDAVSDRLPENVLGRARHVVTENVRVQEAADALESGDAEGFGSLMNASHDSLRDDYEVSCVELDLMVDLARALPGVLGARMTGGGFGGCTVNLVRAGEAADFCREIAAQYAERTGRAGTVIRTRAADGMRTRTMNLEGLTS